VIDRTEAMTVVDVNTGKFVGSGGNLEETVTKNNLEAAEELVRQLRLRDIGGIIVVDFIDMVLEENRDLVLRRLVECLSRDRTKHQVAEVTSLGLVQMTRKKIGVGLRESLDEVNAKVNDNNADPGPTKGRRKGRNGTGDAGGRNTGNGGSGSNGSGTDHKPSQAHQITDDVKNALSRIAASTLAHDEQAERVTGIAGAVSPTSATSVDSPATPVTPTSPVAPETPAESSGGSKRRRRRGSRAGDAQQPSDAVVPQVDAAEPVVEAPETVVEPTVPERAPVVARAPAAAPVEAQKERPAGRRRVSSSAPVTPADTTVAILDIPVGVAKREPRPVSEDTESLLDSVLQALPEPKQPGQGRSRSRRVSSGSISAPAAATDTDDGTVILGS
jgi:ribonuclease E